MNDNGTDNLHCSDGVYIPAKIHKPLWSPTIDVVEISTTCLVLRISGFLCSWCFKARRKSTFSVYFRSLPGLHLLARCHSSRDFTRFRRFCA
jgi:hypothetical protein